MKRMHVHVGVEDLERSISFYSALFATEPAVVKPDYAKWMLDDPRVNFAISTRGKQPGLDHLGIQVESKGELRKSMRACERPAATIIEQGQTTCCYAKSEKSWIDDPAGISWETFFTTGESTDYGAVSENVRARRARQGVLCAASRCAAASTSCSLLRSVECGDDGASLQRAVSCTGNSARSIMAEAILNKLGQGKFRAYSAGSQPKGQVNPHTIRLLQSLGYDTSGFRSKSWE